MKRFIVLMALLLSVLSPMAFALTAQGPYWLVDGQNAGPDLTVEEGEPALAASGAFYSDDDFVQLTVKLKDTNGDDVAVLANRLVDLREYNGFELVDVLPQHYGSAGDYFVHFHMEDSVTTFDDHINLHVTPDSTTCELTFDQISDIEVYEGEIITIDLNQYVTSSDPSWNFHIDAVPQGASWDPAGVFVWMTEEGDDGVYHVTFTVENGCGESRQQTVAITVDDVPACDISLDPVDDVVVEEGEEISFQLHASSSHQVFWEVQDIPPGAVFNAPNGTYDPAFSWIPTYDQAGVYVVTFLASTSPDCVAYEIVTITVNEHSENTCPVAGFDWSPQDPETGETITFTSTSSDADGDSLSYAWDFNNDGIADSIDSSAQHLFNTPGIHPVTLTVSDGECESSITEQISVSAACVLDVVSVDCVDTVVEGDAQFCSAEVDANGAWLGQITVDFHYDDVDGTYTGGTCQTDSNTGACTASFQAPAPGYYTVYADAYRNGCVGDHDRVPNDSFQVLGEGYSIVDASIFTSPDFGTERFDFYRAQDIFVRFRVLDEFDDPVNGGPVSVELRSSAGGQIDLAPYEHLSQSNGYYYYWTQIPWSHDFFGPSNVITVYINLDEGTGGQRVMNLNILNNPPEIASEGVVVMGYSSDLEGSQVSLNAVDPVDLTGTFTVDGEVTSPMMEGTWYELADGRVFHVHDIDYGNDPFSAVVSITADEHLSDVFEDPLVEQTSFYLEQFESDVEDYQSSLDWSVSGLDSALFDMFWDTELNTLTLTPLAQGCDEFTLSLSDLDNDSDSLDVHLCTEPSPEPQCSDGLDNDGDGLIDMDDPDCSSPEDDDESSGVNLTQCSDGIDNDGDGLIDMADPGCLSPSDDDEFNTLPQCSDGIDNDNDGLIDMEDPDCSSPEDDDESSGVNLTQCSDGLDNDGDGFIDLEDPGCDSASDDSEWNMALPQCSDGIDNDGDGLIDMEDPDCVSELDDSEESQQTTTQCSDDMDNDGDGLIDWDGHNIDAGSADLTVYSPILGNSDHSVDFSLAQQYLGMDSVTLDIHVVSFMPDELVIQLNGEGSQSLTTQGDTAYMFENLASGAHITYSVMLAEPIDNCCGLPAADLEVRAWIVVPADPDCDSAQDDNESGASTVETQCSDGLDNDGDGFIDLEDPGCTDASDDDEYNVWPACSDGIDNDGDGLIDMADYGCSSPEDDDESNVLTECIDGLDNDGDGLVDMQDPGCTSWSDDSEFEAAPQCSDNIDNDGDGLIDMYDPDCSSPEDDSEHPDVPQCNDGIDNDGDGLIDLADPHCHDLYDDYEGEMTTTPVDRSWVDRDDLLVTRIEVDGYDVEANAVEPGQYVLFSVALENTLDYDLEDVHVRAFLDAYGLWATKTLHELGAGERKTVNMHVDIPQTIQPDIYDLRITASNDDLRRVKYRHLFVV